MYYLFRSIGISLFVIVWLEVLIVLVQAIIHLFTTAIQNVK